MGQNTNNQFSNFKPVGDKVVGIHEWTQFLNTLNQKLNFLFAFNNVITGFTFANLPNQTQFSMAFTVDGIFAIWNPNLEEWVKIDQVFP
jgi:hypothetical protein